MLESVPSQHLPDICAAMVKASYTEKIQVLDAVDLLDRFKKALPLLMRQIEVNFVVFLFTPASITGCFSSLFSIQVQ